jgi:hypothetical protein
MGATGFFTTFQGETMLECPAKKTTDEETNQDDHSPETYLTIHLEDDTEVKPLTTLQSVRLQVDLAMISRENSQLGDIKQAISELPDLILAPASQASPPSGLPNID